VNYGDDFMKIVPKNESKIEKRVNWQYAITLNQIDGEWKPSDEYMKLIKKEINGEITTQDMREILNKKYLKV
jgi:hypothetical protein